MGLLIAEGVSAQRDGCTTAAATASAITIAGVEEPGERLHISGRVRDREGQARAGVEVRVYHTDDAGYYSRGGMEESQARLCGVFGSDADGSYAVDTIVPGPYATGGPAPHVHFDVRGGGMESFTLTWRVRGTDSAAGNLVQSPRPMVNADDGTWRIEYDLVVAPAVKAGG